MSKKSPDAYRTISEAGAETELPSHVLRFWEGKFSQLKPMKRAGGRRFYRPQDIQLLKGLKRLLYEEGYTIKGAQKYLREHGVAHVAGLADPSNDERLTIGEPVSVETVTPQETASDAPSTIVSEMPVARDLFGNAIEPKSTGMSGRDKSKLKKAYDKLLKARERLSAASQA